MSFDQIKNEFALPRHHFFRYLQVRHFIQSQFAGFPALPPKTPLDSILETKPEVKGILSKLYSAIFDLEDSSLAIIKENWEKDLETDISEARWSKILKRVHSSSICARHGLIQFKIVHRLHMSKVKLSKIFPGVSPLCDRCKQAPASLYHTFWSCPSLTAFWSSIFEAYSVVAHRTIELCPFLGLFGIPSEDLILTKGQLNIMVYSALLARRLILLNWKSDRPPSFGRWICEVMHFLKIEKIRSTAKFHAVWHPFISYVERLTMPLIL